MEKFFEQFGGIEALKEEYKYWWQLVIRNYQLAEEILSKIEDEVELTQMTFFYDSYTNEK